MTNRRTRQEWWKVAPQQKMSLFDQAVACQGLGFECTRTAAISQLDFATQVAYVLIDN
jgi:hypothetical protein